MDHKTLTIAPIVISLAVILLLGANIGLIASVSGKQPADPTNFGPNCVGCITTQNIANGAITHTKIAPHSVDQTQLAFVIHNGTNGAQGPQGPAGPVGQTGATGPVGPQGPIGQTGATGPAGPPGPIGQTGATGPRGVQGVQGVPGLNGTGHVTIYNITYGHDGWNICYNSVGPAICSGTPNYSHGVSYLVPIEGTDLSTITPDSVLVLQIGNVTTFMNGQWYFPLCGESVPFTHGFWVTCNVVGSAQPPQLEPELKVAVINR